MSRIRTIKPEMAKHEALYDLELETKLPIRFAWAMLPTACDREGRFQWRPRTLKADILPHDPVEFSRVLDAWLTRGFVVKYRVGNDWFGWVPTFRKHQVINTRETASALPGFDTAEEVIDHRGQQVADASSTRDPRNDDASGTRAVHARGEGKGKEGKGREGEERSSLRSDSSPPVAETSEPDPAKPALNLTAPSSLSERKAERLKQVTSDAVAAYNAALGKPAGKLAAVHLVNDVREKQVNGCLATARAICDRQYGSPIIAPQFWVDYFAECARDPFNNGTGPYTGEHKNWRPGFEYLVSEKTMTKIFDRAMSEVA